MTIRVVNLGLPKSGTTTLARARRRAGLKTADFRIREGQATKTAPRGAFVADLLYRGYYDTGDPGAFLSGFEAISEMSLSRAGKSLWPQTDFALIRALRRHHPGLKLLATRRGSFDMSQSMLAWGNLGSERLPALAVPGLPAGFGSTSAERELWIDGHYQTLRDMFEHDPAFLEIDVSAPGTPRRIEAHLELALPWWGAANKTALKERPAE